MDPFIVSPLRQWKLETTYDNSGQRCHQQPSGDECWRPIKRLGNGSFGDVWQELCVSGPSQNAVRAVKHLHKRQAKSSEMSRRELDALVTFSDPKTAEHKQYRDHFVQFLGWFDDANCFYLAMELLEYGDLQKYITAPFPEPEAASIVAQVAQALQYMHRNNFVHRDIKPLNILVSSPGPSWHVKVADFGIAKKVDGTALGTHNIGTPGYIAPELYGDSADKYTAAVDVWSLGAVAFCLRTCFPPFRSVNHLLDYARNHGVEFPIEPLCDSSAWCMNFVHVTMADVPQRRLTMERVLAHKWLSGQSGWRESVVLGGSSATGSGTFSLSPLNAWSNTYSSPAMQQERSLSPATPLTEPEPTLLPLPSHLSSLQQASRSQLADGIANLAVAGDEQGNDNNTEDTTSAAPSNEESFLIDLAREHCEQGQYDWGEKLWAKILELRRQKLGTNHQETLDALESLAMAYHEQKKYEEAGQASKELVRARKEALGDMHPDTMNALQSLSEIYAKEKKFKEAEEVATELVGLRRASSGSQNQDMIHALHILAEVYCQEKKFREAEPFAAEVASLRQKTLGPMDPATIRAMRGLAYIYNQQGKYEDAQYINVHTLQPETKGTRVHLSTPTQRLHDKVAESKDTGKAPDGHQKIRLSIIGAHGLRRTGIFSRARIPFPYAVVCVNGDKIFLTVLGTDALNPPRHWNEYTDFAVNKDTNVDISIHNMNKKGDEYIGHFDFRVGDTIDLAHEVNSEFQLPISKAARSSAFPLTEDVLVTLTRDLTVYKGKGKAGKVKFRICSIDRLRREAPQPSKQLTGSTELPSSTADDREAFDDRITITGPAGSTELSSSTADDREAFDDRITIIGPAERRPGAPMRWDGQMDKDTLYNELWYKV
ncbi:uncharacterized protein DSM5745_00700 [Aspergillus mulundensis]|uniref:Protein kinase domain-containing protein n=1 Tax=Aspergillus mulundensis TaxID=1810919 RepID=A0A3D8T5T7_9EURO|nr:hypothetical protein DSM5745_00700 [Aspergillus mulundensis]RDW93378.1 hypothetical protein DSM5745_00700 [Aspergillus mulundensis]